jgi:hypothetical protein
MEDAKAAAKRVSLWLLVARQATGMREDTTSLLSTSLSGDSNDCEGILGV